MLVLSRKVGERIQIGDQITVTVVRINGPNGVRLGIEAPPEMAVAREELIAPSENALPAANRASESALK